MPRLIFIRGLRLSFILSSFLGMSEECNRLESELNRVAQAAEERIAKAENRAREVRRKTLLVHRPYDLPAACVHIYPQHCYSTLNVRYTDAAAAGHKPGYFAGEGRRMSFHLLPPPTVVPLSFLTPTFHMQPRLASYRRNCVRSRSAASGQNSRRTSFSRT